MNDFNQSGEILDTSLFNHDKEVIKNTINNPEIPMTDYLERLKPYQAELSPMGRELLIFFSTNPDESLKYDKDALILFGGFIFIIISLLLFKEMFFIFMIFGSILVLNIHKIQNSSGGMQGSQDQDDLIRTKEYQFFNALPNPNQSINIISLILMNQEYSERLQQFIHHSADWETKVKRFPQAFADVFEEWEKLGNPNIYQQILDIGKLKHENFELLKELSPKLSQESENAFIFQLEQEIRESQDIQQLEKLHSMLEEASIQAMQGKQVVLTGAI